jgi:hypothetical protein
MWIIFCIFVIINKQRTMTNYPTNLTDSQYGAILQIIGDKVCERAYRNKALTEEQKAGNTEKSRFRLRVEHIFGFMEMSMNGMYIQCISIKRTTAL